MHCLTHVRWFSCSLCTAVIPACHMYFFSKTVFSMLFFPSHFFPSQFFPSICFAQVPAATHELVCMIVTARSTPLLSAQNPSLFPLFPLFHLLHLFTPDHKHHPTHHLLAAAYRARQAPSLLQAGPQGPRCASHCQQRHPWWLHGERHRPKRTPSWRAWWGSRIILACSMLCGYKGDEVIVVVSIILIVCLLRGILGYHWFLFLCVVRVWCVCV